MTYQVYQLMGLNTAQSIYYFFGMQLKIIKNIKESILNAKLICNDLCQKVN